MALFQDVLEAFFPAKKGDKPQPKKEPILTSIARLKSLLLCVIEK